MLARIRGFVTSVVVLGAVWGGLALVGFVAGVLPPTPRGVSVAPIPETDEGAQGSAGLVDAGLIGDGGAPPLAAAPVDAGVAQWGQAAPGQVVDAGATPQPQPIAPPSDGHGTATPVAPPSDNGDPAAARPIAAPATPRYTEEVCPNAQPIAPLRAGYDASRLRETLVEVARRRYPQGERFVDAQPDTALVTWVRNPADFDTVVAAFPTVVHEGSHLWIARHRRGRGYVYPVDSERTFRTRHARTMHRDVLMQHHADVANDTYARVYLTGQSGAQGFDTLVDEFNAYTHTLAAYHCIRDALPSGQRVSARDGIRTLRYWVALYLHVARTENQRTYRNITRDQRLARAVVGIWDRSDFWLATATSPELGLRDTMIAGWVTPALREEIARLRLIAE